MLLTKYSIVYITLFTHIFNYVQSFNKYYTNILQKIFVNKMKLFKYLIKYENHKQFYKIK